MNLQEDEINEELTNLHERIKYYSPEELFMRGKDYLNDGCYVEANIVFERLSKIRGKMREVAGLYNHLLSTFIQSSSALFCQIIGDKPPIEFEEEIIEEVISCMVESNMMHAEGNLSKEDLFGIEKLVDEIPYKKLRFSGKEEFEKLYCRFKEYALNVYLREK